MSSKIVPLHQLMVHEFPLVEANIEKIKDTDLKALKGGQSLLQLKQQLKTMQVVLLRDSPDTPALHLVKLEKKQGWDSFDDKKQWALTPEATRCLSPSNAKALEQRAKLANGPVIQASTSSGNLHPPLPMPDYIPEPVVNHVEPDAPLLYEYNLEIIGASQLANVGFSMDKTQTEEARYPERPKQGQYPDSLIYKFKASVNEAKKVRCKRVHDSFNLISQISIPKLYAINSNVVVDSIIFFTPAMQMDERLGLATSGYFYHFHEQKLIQEFHIKGDNRCFFSPTASTHDYLNSTQYIQKVTNTIGVYYQLGGKPATNQHVIYLPTAITREQLDNVNEEWLLEHGMAIDAEALLAARDEAVIESDAQTQSSQSDVVKTKTHIVKSNSDTGKRETWPEIAAQYNLSARELLDFNPSYNDDPMRLAVGDSLVVSAPPQMQPQGVNITEPAATPKDYQCAANCSYEYQRPSFATVHDARITGSTLYPLYSKYLVEETLPVARIQTLPQRTFTIGVFFDGTGQNAKNDEYKETHGDKSRTNIARLFDAYPLTPGKTDKIYVSGVGTVDMEQFDPSVIDEGKDESGLAQALGVELTNLLGRQATWLDSNPEIKALLNDDERAKLIKSSALYKWQSLIKQLNDILTSLVQSDNYSDITHIQFDVFGFSRGAALARHFVNAALKGIPDYDKPRNGDDGLGITPNLLGTESSDAFNPNQGYEVDSSKAVSVR
ncbi:DUF2235 domain-containing protein, partial [Vibrio algivorus]|uniref:DUF2235 domain-containing protein n=1 Tax=Vibrio algivorus TaxID=1667024 RepID=UPI002330FECB